MRRPDATTWTAWGLAALLLAFAVGPVIALISRGVLDTEVLGGELRSAGAMAAVGATLRTALGATFIAVLLGVPVAFLLERTNIAGRRLFGLAFTSLIALPPFILGMGWIQLASPSAGYLNRLGGWIDIYGAPGIAFVNGTSGLPLVILAVQAALARVDTSLEEAARMSGAGPLRAIRDATLPLVLPAIVSGALLVFLSASAAFGVPYMLGVATATPMHVLTTRIYTHLLKGGASALAEASAASAILLVIAMAALAGSAVAGRRGHVRLTAGKGVVVQRLDLGAYRWPLTLAVAALVVVIVVMPLAAVVVTSLLGNASLPIALESLTTSHWHDVLWNHRTVGAAARSFGLASAAAGAVCVLGLAIGITRSRFSGRVAEQLALWPYAVPGTVVAMALLTAYSMDVRFIAADRIAIVLSLANSSSMVMLAYVAKYLAIGSRNVVDGMRQLDPTLAEAARLCGASPRRAFVDVVLPRLRGPLAATFVLTFLLCVTELTMSVLIAPPGRDLLGTLLFDLQSYADPASASVLACAVVVVVVAGLALTSFASGPSKA